MAVKFLKTGKASQELAKQEEIAALQRKESQGKMYRYMMKVGEDAKITFIDGDLDENGFLTPARFYEHTLLLAGKWENYICPEKTDPASGQKCPICESGDRPYLASIFTVIDHRTVKSKDGTKTYVNQRKLFVAKPGTFEILAKIAAKRGGLAGATFDVSRTGDKSASVGTMFDFDKKTPIEELKKMYTREVVDEKTKAKTVVTNFEVANYEHELTYRTADELRKIGLGDPNSPSAGVTNPAGSTMEPVDFSQEL
jgi:hypothetical protein